MASCLHPGWVPGTAKAELLHEGEWDRSWEWHRASPHWQDTIPPHLSMAMVDGGSGAGIFSKFQQETSLETSYQHCMFGVQSVWRAICARKAGDRPVLRDTYNIVKASPRHLSPSLNRSPGPWAENVGRWGLSEQFRPVSALTTLTLNANRLSGPRS